MKGQTSRLPFLPTRENCPYGDVESADPVRDVPVPGCLLGCATLEESEDIPVESDALSAALPLGFVLSPGAVCRGWRPFMPVSAAVESARPVPSVSVAPPAVSLGATCPGRPDVSTPPTPV
jgi:hypothetical protein